MKFTIVTNLWDETGLWRNESLPVSTCLGDVRPSRPRSRSSRGPFSTGSEVVTVAITAGSRVGQAEIGSSIGIAVEEVRVTEDPSEAGDLGTIFGITTAALEVNEVSGDREVSRILDVGKVARHWQATVQDSDVAVTAPDQAVVDTVAVEGVTTSDAGEEEVPAKRSPKMP